MKKLDIVIISNQHHNKLFAGRIGFIIEIRNDNYEKEIRYDIQFPFDATIINTEKKLNQVFQQGQYNIDDITLLQSY